MIQKENKTENKTEFLTKAKFTKMIGQCVIEKRMTHIDAIVYLCDENGIDIQDVKKYVSNVVKSKLESEAQDLHYIPSNNDGKLPV